MNQHTDVDTDPGPPDVIHVTDTAVASRPHPTVEQLPAEQEERQEVSVIGRIADRYGIDPKKLMASLKATVFRTEKGVTNEQMVMLLVVADQYSLNPFTKEIYAFADKNGIIPVVGVDGWSRIINTNPYFDGMEFVDSEQMVFSDEHADCPAWIECRIYRKDRGHPISVRERLSECYQKPKQSKFGGTTKGPWQTHTSRFLRHKAMIQCARLAFGFVGVYDPDEAERIREQSARDQFEMAMESQKARQSKPRSAASALDQFAARPRSTTVIDQIEAQHGTPLEVVEPQFEEYDYGNETHSEIPT